MFMYSESKEDWTLFSKWNQGVHTFDDREYSRTCNKEGREITESHLRLSRFLLVTTTIFASLTYTFSSFKKGDRKESEVR
jgi:hypothetical protein